jgi:hypothetical protein
MMVRKMTKSEAGRIGGLARQQMYGDVGTPEGRSKGGRNSLETHRKLETGFKLLRSIRLPRRSSRLAEFIGIMMGDGHIGKYQTSFCTNSITDVQHANHLCALIDELFGISVTSRKKTGSNAISVIISSKEVCRFLQEHGIPEGNKIENGITIPKWISENNRYSYALIRGLFDTDGCVFLDKHLVKGKLYANMGIAFANKEPALLKFFCNNLYAIGLAPTQTTPFRVFLRRQRDIDMYFKIVGTSNVKHQSRYQKYRKRS